MSDTDEQNRNSIEYRSPGWGSIDLWAGWGSNGEKVWGGREVMEAEPSEREFFKDDGWVLRWPGRYSRLNLMTTELRAVNAMFFSFNFHRKRIK
jgi:hypothetical protein